jgi:hypothetical protein
MFFKNINLNLIYMYSNVLYISNNYIYCRNIDCHDCTTIE